jgi:hypothetical protein
MTCGPRIALPSLVVKDNSESEYSSESMKDTRSEKKGRRHHAKRLR